MTRRTTTNEHAMNEARGCRMVTLCAGGRQWCLDRDIVPNLQGGVDLSFELFLRPALPTNVRMVWQESERTWNWTVRTERGAAARSRGADHFL